MSQGCLHPFQLDLARRLVPAVLPLPKSNKVTYYLSNFISRNIHVF